MIFFYRYNIRPINGVLFQWLNITVRLYSSSSSSSSDSSDSDSDSDIEKVKPKNYVKNTTSTASENKDNLEDFLNNMIQVNYFQLFYHLLIYFIVLLRIATYIIILLYFLANCIYKNG